MNETELFNTMYPRTEDKVVFAVSHLTTLATLISAGRALKKGDYHKALFRVVLWAGMTNNNNAAFAIRYDKATRPRALGMM